MTTSQKNTLDMIMALSEAIRTAGSIPSGHLYSIVMGTLSLESYNAVINCLKNTGLVSESGHVLKWEGPV